MKMAKLMGDDGFYKRCKRYFEKGMDSFERELWSGSYYIPGKSKREGYHAENIWAGETYAVCALAIYEGFIDEALDIARRTWENFVYNRRNVWSQPDVIFAHDGSLGDGELYVRNMSLWGIPFALARPDKSIKEFLLRLEPKLQSSL